MTPAAGLTPSAPPEMRKSGLPEVEALGAAHFVAVAGLREGGVDGDAADGDVVGGQAEDFEVDFAFLERDEVAVEDAGEPHGVDIEVGHDNGEAGVEFALGDEVGDDFRGEEVGADGDVGLEFGDEALERAGVEAVEHEAHAVGFPRLVGGVVDDAEDGGRFLDELDVELGVEVAEEAVGEAERVDVADLADAGLLEEGFFERFRSADVAGAGAGGEDEDAAALGVGGRADFQRGVAAGAEEAFAEVGHAPREGAFTK